MGPIVFGLLVLAAALTGRWLFREVGADFFGTAQWTPFAEAIATIVAVVGGLMAFFGLIRLLIGPDSN